jgi:hypothetical protein
MAMYLARVLILVGRWSSTAILKYIRKQIQEFSHGISSKMIEIKSFKDIQNTIKTNLMETLLANFFFADGINLAEEASSPKGWGQDQTN